MAQLGDLVRAKALLRRAARGFGPKEAVARARCIVAEAEIALVSRDLSLACEGARRSAGDARSARRPRKCRACAQSRGPAPAPDRPPRRGRAHARRARPHAAPARVEGRPRAGGCGDRDAAPADEDGARGARAGRARRARRRYPCADGGGRKRIPRDEHARGAPDRARRGTPPPARGGRSAAGVEGAGRGRLPPCRAGRSAWWSRSRRARYCSRLHARWAKPGPQTCRGARSSHAPSEASTPMNRIAHGCGSKSGGFARSFGRWPT